MKNNLAVKKLSALLRGITWEEELLRGITKRNKYNADIYCLNCLHSFRTENNLKISWKSMQKQIFVEL